MSTRRSIIAFLIFIGPVAIASRGADTESKATAVKVPNHGDLLLVIPDGWTQKDDDRQPPGAPPTVVIAPKAPGRVCEVMITPMTGRDPKFTSPEALKRWAQLRGKPMLRTAKEQALEIHDFKGDSAAGSYFTLTDKAPGPGEFEYMTTCFVGVGDLLLTATILHHQKDAPELKLALDMLKGAKQSANASPKEKETPLKIAAPGAPWQLSLGGGLKVLEDQSNAARKIRDVMAESHDSGM